MHGDSGCPELDWAKHALHVGGPQHTYPFNTNVLNASASPAAVQQQRRRLDESGPITPPAQSQWAYTCSSDCAAQCPPSVPTIENGTCAAVPQGFHLHLYFANNDAASVAAKDKFHGTLQRLFQLPAAVCPDNDGHEQFHNHTCWLTGPGGRESPTPQASPTSSFVMGTHSLYIPLRDSAAVISAVLVNKNADAVGAPLPFLLHPTFGCNFADHRPSRAKSASRSVRRALLTPQVNPGSRYRCGTRT